MKTLNSYIFESSNAILKSIIGIKFDFSSCSSMPTSTKEERVKKGKAQEEIAIKAIQEVLTDYEVMSCEEWCKTQKLNYSPKIDSYYGDIMICKDGQTLYNIDLKVGTKTYLGTPDALSLSNFGNNSVKEAGKYIYLCANENGDNKVIITQQKLFKIQKAGKFVCSMNRTKELKSNAFEKAKVLKNKNVPDADLSKLYEEDFVLTSIVQDNKDL